ncbi:thioesterase family protein [Motiliproteus sediminis]|uniref:thioesterase family protein n=1 Tax=Motiliproteus sediminis TaxID=1468178 RepID=UPI001AEF4183
MEQQQLIDGITDHFNHQVPFHQLIGIEVIDVSAAHTLIRAPMKPELIGNTFQQILHGGVTATLLDIAGGLAAMSGTINKLSAIGIDEVVKRLQKISTIDMRVDYLMPGRGDYFEAEAHVIRHGNRVAVTRMALKNESGNEIALGTATYSVS